MTAKNFTCIKKSFVLNSSHMGKYLGIVIGSVVAILGIKGLCAWWCDFLTLVKGAIPVMLILGGAIAVIAGISEIKDELSAKKDKKA